MDGWMGLTQSTIYIHTQTARRISGSYMTSYLGISVGREEGREGVSCFGSSAR